jgi:hypothetical protein
VRSSLYESKKRWPPHEQRGNGWGTPWSAGEIQAGRERAGDPNLSGTAGVEGFDGQNDGGGPLNAVPFYAVAWTHAKGMKWQIRTTDRWFLLQNCGNPIDATALAGLLGGRTDERSRQDDSEEKYAPMTEAHAMGKISILPSLSGRCSWDPTMCDRQWPAPGGPCGRRVASREVSLQAHPH